MTQEAVLAERAAIDAEVEGKTIVDYLDRNAERHGDQPAPTTRTETEEPELSEYRQAVHEAAAGFQALGVGEGEFVAIMAGNCPEHVIADYAAIHAGQPRSPFTHPDRSPDPVHRRQLQGDRRGARELEFMKRWEEIRSELPNLRYVVLMSGAENYDTADWVLSWDELLVRARSGSPMTPAR